MGGVGRGGGGRWYLLFQGHRLSCWLCKGSFYQRCPLQLLMLHTGLSPVSAKPLRINSLC